MVFDIVVWAAVAWMMFMSYLMNTNSVWSGIFFKVVPFAISIALAVVWALERGFIINTGG